MIQLHKITIQLTDEPLLCEVTHHIPPKEKVVIRGPSGCGKSTLLKAIAGAVPLQAGSITVDSLALTPHQMNAIRARIAFIGQEPVMGAATVRAALLLPFTFKAHHHTAPDESTLLALLNRLKLTPDILHKPTNRISGGEKQRIAIARALLLKKTIFLADEITSALDPESKQAVIDELFKPDYTLLSISHDPDWMAACRCHLTIHQQKLLEERPADPSPVPRQPQDVTS
jgi:putative ABC transport system ATP-binding protein